jgi:hypothetical protein
MNVRHTEQIRIALCHTALRAAASSLFEAFSSEPDF